MKLGPLTLFCRMNSNGKPIDSYLVAAWHWPWSLTWRWVFVKAPWYGPPGNQGFSFMRTYTYRRDSFNFHACFNSRWTGHWSIKTQPNMDQRRRHHG